MDCQKCSKPNFTPVGQNGVDVPDQNAKLLEQGKIQQCVYLFILFVYIFLFLESAIPSLKICVVQSVSRKRHIVTPKVQNVRWNSRKENSNMFMNPNPHKRVVTKWQQRLSSKLK